MKPVIYIAGPVSSGGAGSVFENVQRMLRWVKWFVQKDPTRIYIAPWVAEVLGFINGPVDPAFYQRVLDDDCEVVARLHGVVGVGTGLGAGWTKGMAQERATARALGRSVLDLTHYEEPADVPEGFDLNAEWVRTNPGPYTHVEPY